MLFFTYVLKLTIRLNYHNYQYNNNTQHILHWQWVWYSFYMYNVLYYIFIHSFVFYFFLFPCMLMLLLLVFFLSNRQHIFYLPPFTHIYVVCGRNVDIKYSTAWTTGVKKLSLTEQLSSQCDIFITLTCWELSRRKALVKALTS